MTHPIAPDTTKRTGVQPTHFHCYRWSGHGSEWARLGGTDTLDLDSPDRPPVRTSEWLIKSPRFIDAVHTEAAAARDWLIGQWESLAGKAMTPVPAWVDSGQRAERALRAIQTGCWPTYSQWITGGSIVLVSVVGTAEPCH